MESWPKVIIMVTTSITLKLKKVELLWFSGFFSSHQRSATSKGESGWYRKLKLANYKPKIEKDIARILNAVRVTLWLSLVFFLVKRKVRKQIYSAFLPYWKLFFYNSWTKNGAVTRDSFQLYNWYFIIFHICDFDINYPLYFYGPLTLILILWHLRAVTR